MKKRLLVLTSPVSFLINFFSKKPLRHIIPKNNLLFLTDCADTTRDKVPLFIEGRKSFPSAPGNMFVSTCVTDLFFFRKEEMVAQDFSTFFLN